MEFKRRFGWTDEVPVLPEKIREEFPQWLEKVAGAGRIVLVLDALNQLEDRDNAPDLGCLRTAGSSYPPCQAAALTPCAVASGRR